MTQSKIEEIKEVEDIDDSNSDADIKIVFDSDEELVKTQEFNEAMPTFDLLSNEDKFLQKYGKDVDDTMSFITAKDLMDEKANWRLGFKNELMLSKESKEEFKQKLICKEDIKKMEVHALKSRSRVINCNLQSYKIMKHQWLQYFTPEIARGYYMGNLAIARCAFCVQVIDAWPCKEKREYKMPDDHCPYCKDKVLSFNAKDYKMYQSMVPRRNWIEYVVNNDY